MKKICTFIILLLLIGVNNIQAQETTKKTDKTTSDKMDKSMNDHHDDMMDSKDHKSEKDMSKNDNYKNGNVNAIIKDWPMHTQKTAEETMKAYGTPDGITDKELIWYNAGNWEMIRLSKEETNHDFPVAHTDYIQMTIYHNVPTEKMDELGAFDGSVTFDRTQGFLSARCDMEANNFLALNLAHDIINDKKTVEEARKAYADIIKEKMSGANPEYMKKLQFNVETKAAADAGINTTGLTKAEVMAAIKKNSKM